VTLTFDLKFASPVTRVQGHVSTKLDVSTAFLFYGRTEGQTDVVQYIMQHPRGPHNNTQCFVYVIINIFIYTVTVGGSRL